MEAGTVIYIPGPDPSLSNSNLTSIFPNLEQNQVSAGITQPITVSVWIFNVIFSRLL